MKKVAWKCGCAFGAKFGSHEHPCSGAAAGADAAEYLIRHNLRRPKLIFNYWIGACVIYAFIMVIIEHRQMGQWPPACTFERSSLVARALALTLTSRARETISERVNWSRNAARYWWKSGNKSHHAMAAVKLLLLARMCAHAMQFLTNSNSERYTRAD